MIIRIYEKYLFKNVAYSMGAITFFITCIILLTQSLKYANLVMDSGASISNFLYLSFLLLPPLLFTILPITMFISNIFIYNKLTINHELTSMKAAGISYINLAKPSIILAIIITIFNYTNSFYIMPKANREFKDIQSFFTHNFVSILLQEGVFIHPNQDITIYIKERTADDKLKNVFLYDSRNKNNPSSFVAKEGMFIEKLGKTYLELYDGNRQEISKDSQLSIIYFDFLSLELNINSKYSERNKTIQEYYINELFKKNANDSQSHINKKRSELHYRLLWPATCLILTLIAAYYSICSEYNRYGNIKKIIVSSIVSMCVVILIISGTSMGATYPILIFNTYIIISILLVFLIYQFKNCDFVKVLSKEAP